MRWCQAAPDGATDPGGPAPRLWLFLSACLLGGIGGAGGSILGHAFGPRGLWVGGLLGGTLLAALSAPLAVWRRWIAPAQARATALGASAGFLLAAAIATRTLSSPVGPVLSTSAIGLGALLGARLGTRPPASPPVDAA